MLTWSLVMPAPQGPLSTVHVKMFSPTARPVTVAFGSEASEKVPCPCCTVHTPVAGKVRALPASVALVTGVQTCWSGPASATGFSSLYTVMLIWSEVGASQGPFSTVHSNTFTPTASPLTRLVGEVASAKTPDPFTNTHWPVAGPISALPAMVV